MQRRLPAGVGGVDVRTVRQEEFRDGQVAFSGGGMERRAALGAGGVAGVHEVRAVLDDRLDALDLGGLLAGLGHRNRAARRCRGWPGLTLNRRHFPLHREQLAAERDLVQGRRGPDLDALLHLGQVLLGELHFLLEQHGLAILAGVLGQLPLEPEAFLLRASDLGGLRLAVFEPLLRRLQFLLHQGDLLTEGGCVGGVGDGAIRRHRGRGGRQHHVQEVGPHLGFQPGHLALQGQGLPLERQQVVPGSAAGIVQVLLVLELFLDQRQFLLEQLFLPLRRRGESGWC